MFWWIKQFWHLTEVPETSAMCFLQTWEDRKLESLDGMGCSYSF